MNEVHFNYWFLFPFGRKIMTKQDGPAEVSDVAPAAEWWVGDGGVLGLN